MVEVISVLFRFCYSPDAIPRYISLSHQEAIFKSTFCCRIC